VTQAPPSTDQGTTIQPPLTSDDNKALKHKLPKGTKRKDNNNDNSPTPPACPDKGPIPQNCTLKPKF
jgi:hypothetical protein